MKACEGRLGRIFVLRLEDGDEVPGCIERFAAEKQVQVGFALLVGGVAEGEVVVGPRKSSQRPPEPMRLEIEGAHEIGAVGVLAPDESGTPVLHMHGAMGRSGTTLTGCLRSGVKTWLTGEVILYEVVGAAVKRLQDAASGLALLTPTGDAAATAPEPATAPAEPPAPAATPATQPEPGSDEKRSRFLYLYNAEVN